MRRRRQFEKSNFVAVIGRHLGNAVLEDSIRTPFRLHAVRHDGEVVFFKLQTPPPGSPEDRTSVWRGSVGGLPCRATRSRRLARLRGLADRPLPHPTPSPHRGGGGAISTRCQALPLDGPPDGGAPGGPPARGWEGVDTVIVVANSRIGEDGLAFMPPRSAARSTRRWARRRPGTAETRDSPH
jgi:hypothetical protein